MSVLFKNLSKFVVFIVVTAIIYYTFSKILKELNAPIKEYEPPKPPKLPHTLKKSPGNYVYFSNIKLTPTSLKIRDTDNSTLSQSCGIKDKCYAYDTNGYLFTHSDLYKSDLVPSRSTGLYVKVNSELNHKISSELCKALDSELVLEKGRCNYPPPVVGIKPLNSSKDKEKDEWLLQKSFKDNVNAIDFSSLIDEKIKVLE